MSVLPLKEKKAPGYILGLCLCLYATDPAHLAIIKDLSVCSFRRRRLASIECLHFVTRFLKLRLSLFQVRRIEVQHSVHRVFLARVRESSDGNKTSWNMLEQVGTKPDHWSKNQSEPRTAPHAAWLVERWTPDLMDPEGAGTCLCLPIENVAMYGYVSVPEGILTW